MVLHLELQMVSHLDWMKELSWSLTLMKASYSALLMVNYLALHLGLQMELHFVLMKELSWVLQMAPLVVLMKANLRVPCLEHELDKKLVLRYVLMMVLKTIINMEC